VVCLLAEFSFDSAVALAAVFVPDAQLASTNVPRHCWIAGVEPLVELAGDGRVSLTGGDAGVGNFGVSACAKSKPQASGNIVNNPVNFSIEVPSAQGLCILMPPRGS